MSDRSDPHAIGDRSDPYAAGDRSDPYAAGDRSDPYVLPADLPGPVDDGAGDHLEGAAMPSLLLPSTTGREIDLAAEGRGTLVLYCYPRTGRPGEPLPPGWDGIPGARGCTPQACAFRDHFAELERLGASVLGLSSQPLADQAEFASRVRLPYPVVSDPGLRLAEALRLPTFEVAGMRLYRRLTLIARRRRIVKVFYPVFPPDRNAADVVAWLTRRSSGRDTGTPSLARRGRPSR